MGLGSLRFFLAFLVAISHLWANMIHGPAAYAVWCFFVLSGFLMTYILQNKYGKTTGGLKAFAYNRFLRIYPLYYLACIFGFFAILFSVKYNIQLTSINPQFKFPENLGDWLNNLLLLPIFGGSGLFVPVSGALSVEVMAYILMPLIAFSKRAALLGLLLAVALNFSHGINVESFPIRYSSFFTAYLTFCLGALICHFREFLSKFNFPIVSFSVWSIHCLVWVYYDKWPWTYGLYFSLILSSWLIISLYKIKSNKLDTLLGDLSYPIYLFHTVVAAFVGFFIGNSRTFAFFTISFFVTIFLSLFLIRFFDKSVRKFKLKVISK
ncbi:COG1835 Predicted acyltransferases [Candidatus Methylopumilus universalis]|uniref:acyltransferase family protein n=1 Tax=Candidatus Methylopumilus universalis TaxID=2588536 RepID=UPI003BEF205E